MHATPHSDSLYSGSEHSQFNSPRLIKREAGFPNPRRELIGSNQLRRVNDSPYYREQAQDQRHIMVLSIRSRRNACIKPGVTRSFTSLVWPHLFHRYVKLRVAHAPGMPGTFSLPPRVSDPGMHQGTCVTHVLWCMSGSLTSGYLWSRWRGKRSRHSRRMRNPQFYVSGKRPISKTHRLEPVWSRGHPNQMWLVTVMSLVPFDLISTPATDYSFHSNITRDTQMSIPETLMLGMENLFFMIKIQIS